MALGMEALLVPLQLEQHALPHLGSTRCTQMALRLHSGAIEWHSVALRWHSDGTHLISEAIEEFLRRAQRAPPHPDDYVARAPARALCR